MSKYTLPNSTTGIDSILVEITSQLPLLTVMFSIFLFFFVFLSGMSLQGRRSGFVDPPLWSTLALLVVVFFNLLLSMGTGFVNPIVLTVAVTLTLFSALWLFLSRGRFDQ